MRRVVGACVVAGLIGAWNLAGDWLTRPGVSSRADSVNVLSADSAAAPASPVPRIVAPARGKIIPLSFRRDPLDFLSTAPADSLDLLPGVGPVLAARIIETRAARGRFVSWDDVLAVKGVGPRTVARWQALHERQ